MQERESLLRRMLMTIGVVYRISFVNSSVWAAMRTKPGMGDTFSRGRLMKQLGILAQRYTL